MTHVLQQPDKPPAPGTTLPTEKQGNDLKNGVPEKKDQAVPDAEAPRQDIPIHQPPGALIAVPPKEEPKNHTIGSILIPALWLIAILGVGAILLAWLKKNRERQFSSASLSANEQLTSFRDSLDQGDMTDEEFKKVKAHLSEKIRKPVQPVPAASGQAPETGQAHATKESAK